MKYAFTIEHCLNRKDDSCYDQVWTTDYIVHVPNYASVVTTELEYKVKTTLSTAGATITVLSIRQYSDDALTNSEKKQLDLYGTIRNPSKELVLTY